MNMNFFKDSEIEKILPLEKIIAVIGDPKLKIYHNEQIKHECIEGYNIATATKAMKKGAIMNIMRLEDYRESKDYDKMLGITIPQVLIQDTLKNYHPTIRLHMALMEENEIFIEELILANPKRKFDKKPMPNQNYPGIKNKVFKQTMKNIEEYARKQGIKTISLQALTKERYDIFEKLGYEIDDREDIMMFIGYATKTMMPMMKTITQQSSTSD